MLVAAAAAEVAVAVGARVGVVPGTGSVSSACQRIHLAARMVVVVFLEQSVVTKLG